MKIPSSGKEIMVRPMLVKEEKILLMAKEGDDYSEKLLAIKQVVNNCCQNLENIDSLTIFDIEYLFLKIRAISVDNMVKIMLTDEDDGEEREFEIDLSKVEIDMTEKKDNVIPLGETAGITLRYPTCRLYEQIGKIENQQDLIDALVVNSLVNYYDGDEMYDFTKETKENLEKFVEDNINAATYYKIREFLESMPTLKHDIKYKNNDGKEKTVTLSSLNDFFIF
jgi:hypothetical protein